MSETHVPDQHGSSTVVAGAHGSTSDHGDGHGHDDHAHPSDALGPIDWTMWGAGVVGVIMGLIVTAGLVAATGFSFSA
jgi:hypothetical protein